MKRLIIDLDNTLCTTNNGDYKNSIPVVAVVERLRWYKLQGFEIIINTSRNMRTYDGCLGKINAITLPLIISWLNQHQIPYDEIYIGKPWCGNDGFYVDDRAVRPSEFVSLSYESLLKKMDHNQ